MKPDSSRIQTKRPTGASASLRVLASGSKGGGSFKVKPPTEVKASFEKSPVKTEPSFETEPSLEKIPTSAESSLKLGPHGLDPLRRLLGDSSAKRLATYFAKAALLVVTVYLLSFAVTKMPASPSNGLRKWVRIRSSSRLGTSKRLLCMFSFRISSCENQWQKPLFHKA